MACSTDFIAETTDTGHDSEVISNLLRFMQISGALLLNECYLAPWAISIPNHKVLAEQLGSHHATHIVAFHLVQRGSIEVVLESGENYTAYEGEIVICYSGQGHTIYQGSRSPAHPFEKIMQDGKNIFKPEKDKEAQSTALICGVFQLQDTARNPLFEALPPVIKISTRQRSDYSYSTIKNIIELLLSEMAQPSFSHGYVVERYLELLCASSICTYIETSDDEISGWLQAIKDPMVAQVINAIHSQPDYHWTVTTMAELGTLSPSRFAARFTEIMGVSPMAYVTQWRMYLASKLLNHPKSNIEKIASTTGYENVAAFSRAFKRTMGMSPGVWRTSHRTL